MNKELSQKITEIEQHLDAYNNGVDVDIHPFEIAELLDEVYDVDQTMYLRFLKKLPKTLLAEVLVELPKGLQDS